MKKLITILLILATCNAWAQYPPNGGITLPSQILPMSFPNPGAVGTVVQRIIPLQMLGIPTVNGAPTNLKMRNVGVGALVYDSTNNIYYGFNPGDSTFTAFSSGTSTCFDGLKAGTGAVTQLTDSTFFVDNATFYLNCTDYPTSDSTIEIDNPNDTAFVAGLFFNTNGTVTYIKGPEGVTLALPPYDPATQFPAAYIIVTPSGVIFSGGSKNCFVQVGNMLIDTCVGSVSVPDIQAGPTYVKGTNSTVKIHTQGEIVSQLGFGLANPANSYTKRGFYAPTASRIDLYDANNKFGDMGLPSGTGGSFFNLAYGNNVNTGTGNVFNMYRSAQSVLPVSGTNTNQYNQYYADPTITQSTFGSGPIAAFHYKPTVNSLNGSAHYLLWGDGANSGLIRAQGLGTASGDTSTYKPIGIDASGVFKPMTYWPGSGGSGGGPSSGNGTTVVGTAVNWGGTISSNVVINGAFNVHMGQTIGLNEFKVNAGTIAFDGNFNYNGTLLKIPNIPSQNNATDSMVTINTADGTIGYKPIPEGLSESEVAAMIHDSLPTPSDLTVDPDDFVLSGDSLKLKNGHGVKKYVALLFQSGTDAPIARVMENTIGEIVWSYSGTGIYIATLSGAFPSNKVVMSVVNTADGVSGGVAGSCNRVDDDSIRLTVGAIGGGFLDDELTNDTSSITITVYP